MRNLSAVLIGQPSTSFRFLSADWLLLFAMRMKAKILSTAVAVFRDESFSVLEFRSCVKVEVAVLGFPF